ncbi:MAG TPA: hypothetical protein VHV77_13265, partial [Pirellulales bacterium]|nr:hypothetical protein [Pirellulales bacterium]
RAESQHEIGNLQNIQSAAKKESNWRAAAWTLERKYPQRYGRRTPNVITPEQVAQFLTALGAIIASEISDEALRRRVMQRLKRLLRPPTKFKRRGDKHG